MIDKDGPPSAEKISKRDELGKSLWDIGQVAMMVGDLMGLKERLELEAAMEGDDSSMAAQCAASLTSIAQFLRNLVAEETAEAIAGTEIDEPVDEPVTSLSLVALAALSEIIKSEIPETDRAEALVDSINKLGARHDAAHQAQLDGSAYLTQRAMGVGSMRRAVWSSASKMYKVVLDAGAAEVRAEGREMLTNSNPVAGSPTQNSTVDTGRAGATAVPNSIAPRGAGRVAMGVVGVAPAKS